MVSVPGPSPVGVDDALSSVAAWEPPLSVDAGPPSPKEATVRLALRVVVELARRPPPADGGTAQWQSTQQGLAEQLSVTQGAVSKVLARLVAAEVATQERRHVYGVTRRVRVYFLTRQGEELAREIRGRFGLTTPPGPPYG
jgi:DNA-binding MarR family transcriptional regulator